MARTPKRPHLLPSTHPAVAGPEAGSTRSADLAREQHSLSSGERDAGREGSRRLTDEPRQEPARRPRCPLWNERPVRPRGQHAGKGVLLWQPTANRRARGMDLQHPRRDHHRTDAKSSPGCWGRRVEMRRGAGRRDTLTSPRYAPRSKGKESLRVGKPGDTMWRLPVTGRTAIHACPEAEEGGETHWGNLVRNAPTPTCLERPRGSAPGQVREVSQQAPLD